MKQSLRSVTFQQFIAGVVGIEKSYSVVEEYDLVHPFNVEESKRPDPNQEECTYTRHIAHAIDLEPETLRAQYLASPGLLTISGHTRDRDVMIETACQYIRDHYGEPSTLIDLGNGLLAVADIEFHTIKLKKISADKGAIVLMTPRKHLLIQMRG